MTLSLSLLVGGLIVLLIGARLRPLERVLDRVISLALEKWTELKVIDYAGLLNLNKGYIVAYLPVDDVCWIKGKTLRELALANEGILVLNIVRENGVTIATPASTTRLHAGDRILAYGLEQDLTRLRERRSGGDGDLDHDSVCRKQSLRLVEERTEDRIADESN